MEERQHVAVAGQLEIEAVHGDCVTGVDVDDGDS